MQAKFRFLFKYVKFSKNDDEEEIYLKNTTIVGTFDRSRKQLN